MAGIYETWARDLPLGFNGPNNQALWGAIAKVVGDDTLADVRQAILERFPGFASPESNAITANDRQLERSPTESEAQFVARLIAAPTLWKLAGSPIGMLVALYYADFPGALLVTQNGLGYSLTSAPDLASLQLLVDEKTAPSWLDVVDLGLNPAIPASTDGKPAIAAGTIPWWVFPSGPMDAEGNQWCSRFGILFPAPNTIDLSIAANLARIRRTIAAWKDAKARCAGIWVASSGAFWGAPGLVWGGFAWGGVVTYYTAE